MAKPFIRTQEKQQTPSPHDGGFGFPGRQATKTRQEKDHKFLEILAYPPYIMKILFLHL